MERVKTEKGEKETEIENDSERNRESGREKDGGVLTFALAISVNSRL